MCLIKFWIINIINKNIVFEKIFPINLHKSKNLGFNGSNLNSNKIKEKNNFVNTVFKALGFDSSKKNNKTDENDWNNSDISEKLEFYDFSVDNKLPVVELNLDESLTIWPFIVIEHNKNLFCGLPLVLNDSKELIDHLNISIGFSTLKAIIVSYTNDKNLINLELFINKFLPFGQLISYPSKLTNENLNINKKKNKDSVINLRINEHISSSNLDKETIYGTVHIDNNKALGENCKMVLTLPEIDNLNLVLSPYCKIINNNREKKNLQINLNQIGNKMVHYLCDNQIFKPFIFYDYTVTRTNKFQYKLNLNVTVNAKVNLIFNFFNIIFTNCFAEKTARLLNSNSDWGQLCLEKNGLTWYIGTKLPKSLNFNLEMNIECEIPDFSFTEANLIFKTEDFNYAFPKLTQENMKVINSDQKSKLITEFNFDSVNYKLVANIV